jgi:hypothetical protein
MTSGQKKGPQAIARAVQRRYPDELMALRDALAPHPGPAQPLLLPGSATGRAITMADTRISVAASALRTPERADITEWRVSVVAHTLIRGLAARRVPIRPAEAEGWARAVFGEPLEPYLYQHRGAGGLAGTDGVMLSTPYCVVHHNNDGPVPAPPELGHYAQLVLVSQ